MRRRRKLQLSRGLQTRRYMCMRGGTILCLWVCRVGEKLLERLRISNLRLEGPKKPDPNRDGSNKDSLNNPNKDGPNKDGLNKDGLNKDGPKKDDPKPTIEDMFSHLFIDATKPDSTIRFLSRFDKSATNIKESAF